MNKPARIVGVIGCFSIVGVIASIWAFFRRFALFGAVALWVAPASAHDVPDEVSVLMFVKPEGGTLSLLLRAPMRALRDLDVPITDQGFLDLHRIDTALEHASQVWIRDFIRVYESGELLAQPTMVDARVSLATDRSFDGSYDQAFDHTTRAELPDNTRMIWEDGLMDIAYEYPITSDESQFFIEPSLTRLGVEVRVLMRYLGADGAERMYDVHADVGRVALDPNLFQAAFIFAKKGFQQIVGTSAYLLVLTALVIPVMRVRAFAAVGAAFIAGQSATLIAFANGLAPNTLWHPYLIQFLIAGSVLFLAVDNILGTSAKRRWRIAVFAGAIYGFGLSYPLVADFQFSGAHEAASIWGFALGAGIADAALVAVLAFGIKLAAFFFTSIRTGVIVLSAFIAHSAWQPTLDQLALVRQFPWPRLDALSASGALSWLIAAVAVAAFLWVSYGLKPRSDDPAEDTLTSRRAP